LFLAYCPNCGISLGEESRFCPGCGRAIAGEHEGPTATSSVKTITVPTITIPPDAALRVAQGWQGPAIGAAAALILGIALAVITNVIVIAGVKGAGFSIAPAIGILVYGSLGVSSVGSISPGVDVPYLSGNGSLSYSVSLTILGGFMLMMASLAFAGWLSSRYGKPEDRGSIRAGVKTALLFAVLMFICSFQVSYFSMHPRHFEALIFPLFFALLAAPIGSRIERDGRGFWRAPVHALGVRYPEVVQALGSGFDALMRALKLSGVGLGVALIVLAIKYPDEAGLILNGRRVIAEILLLPLYLPHLVGAMFVAAQGIGFQVGADAGGTVGTIDSLTGNHIGDTYSVSIFGGNHGLHVPTYLLAALLIPIATALWGGFIAANRRGGVVQDRIRVALIASAPFVVFSWVICALIGITVKGGFTVVSGNIGFGTVPVNAIFWPLLWGPGIFLVGAMIQVWRAGDLAAVATQLRARAEAATAVAAPAVSASARGTVALVEPSVATLDAERIRAQMRMKRRCPHCTAEIPRADGVCHNCKKESPAWVLRDEFWWFWDGEGWLWLDESENKWVKAGIAAQSAAPTVSASANITNTLTEPSTAMIVDGSTAAPESGSAQFCPQCGNERSPGKRFCTSCGCAFFHNVDHPLGPTSSGDNTAGDVPGVPFLSGN